MRFIWHEPKRQANLKKHGMDFADAERVFAGPTFTFEDDREDYGEQRWVTLGLLSATGRGDRAYRNGRGNPRHFHARGRQR